MLSSLKSLSVLPLRKEFEKSVSIDRLALKSFVVLPLLQATLPELPQNYANFFRVQTRIFTF